MVSSFDSKLVINSMLLGAVVTMFFLVSSFNAEILVKHQTLAIQMVLAIPLFVSACFASSLQSEKNGLIWYTFGWISFIFAYSFTINSVGIIISSITSATIGISFFIFSIFLSLIYSFLLVVYEKSNLIERVLKDLVFILILFFLGILVVL